MDFSAHAFFQKSNLKLQDSGAIFVSGKFSAGTNQITLFMKRKPGFLCLPESNREGMPLSGFQEVYRELPFFTGERKLLHTLRHIIVENLDKQRKKSNALWRKFKNFPIQL